MINNEIEVDFLDYEIPKINISTSQIYIDSFDKYIGYFDISNLGKGILKADIFSENHNIKILNSSVYLESKSSIQIKYEIDINFNPIYDLASKIIIQSNIGEFIIPIKIYPSPPILKIKGNNIKNLNEFYQFAKIEPNLAVSIFANPDFMIWLFNSKYKFMDIYDKILENPNKNKAMNNFFSFNKLNEIDNKDLKLEKKEKENKNFDLKLNKLIYNSNYDTGYIFIKNNTDNNFTIKIENKNQIINFKKNIYTIEKEREINFFIKSNSKFLEKDKLFDTIYIKIIAEINKKIISKNLKIEISGIK